MLEMSEKVKGQVAAVLRPTREALAFGSAYALIADPAHWVAGTAYADNTGSATWKESATRFCAHGAMHFSGMTDGQRSYVDDFSNRLVGAPLMEVNDVRGRHQALRVMRGYAQEKGWELPKVA